jgi:hypothetical protein
MAGLNAAALSRLIALRAPAVPQGLFMQSNPFLNQTMGLAA